ncbi:MAG TPA: protein-disulfide reductase DsbD domain-containing protein [Tianweitania sediminis]|jgi:DsbC/DsbD-like thiol-disulfide interchange protein|nr:protein-disulfide reductase DsbD domain-containing protein [Tianweitania sediminis]
MHQPKLLISAALLLASATNVQAASSSWFETEGGRIRLVSTGLPDENGQLRGALQVDLKPGWRTYWRDPGDAGVPPQLTPGADGPLGAVTLHYPAPQRFEDHGSHWTGYSQSVSFALDLSLDPSIEGDPFTVDVFLGICQTICIPVQTQLSLDPDLRADDLFDRAVVGAAFDSLPHEAGAQLGITAVEMNGADLLTKASGLAGDDPLLFLAGDGGYQFGTPRFDTTTQRFETEILSRPKVSGSVTIHYTLSHGGNAVQGSFVLPPQP